MKILRDFKSEFQNWDSLINEAKTKRIHCSDVGHIKFINALKTVKSVSHRTIFTNPKFEEITSLLNQIRYFKPDNSVVHFSFIDDLYGISKLIKLINKLPSGQKLFDAGVFTNFGMYSQFLITGYIAKKLKIIDLEVKNPPLNTDILTDTKHGDIHFHIKDVRETEREERLASAIFTLDHVLSNRAHGRNAKRRLSVNSFTGGIPPAGLPANYWENFAQGVEEKPHTVKLKFPANNNTKNTEEINISIGFGWKDYSGIFNGPKTSFNNWARIASEYTKIDELVKNNAKDGDCHILIAITEDKYSWSSIKRDIKNDDLGLVLIDMIEFGYDRSPFMMPKKYNNVEKFLEGKFPKNVRFVFK